MAGANVAFSNLLAALAQGKEVNELRSKLDKELEQREEIESDEQKQRTKSAVKSLAADVSNKVTEISKLRKEKEREIEEDDFLDEEDQKVLLAYNTAEKEAVQLAKDIKNYLSQDDVEMGRVEKDVDMQSEGLEHGIEPTPGTSSGSSTEAKKQKAKQKCPTCGKHYHKVWLEVHKKRCGQKEREKFECSKCQSSFLSKSYMEKHSKSCTGETKSTVCPKCNKGKDRDITVLVNCAGNVKVTMYSGGQLMVLRFFLYSTTQIVHASQFQG